MGKHSIEDLIKSLFFCISLSLVWVHNLGAQTDIPAPETVWIFY